MDLQNSVEISKELNYNENLCFLCNLLIYSSIDLIIIIVSIILLKDYYLNL